MGVARFVILCLSRLGDSEGCECQRGREGDEGDHAPVRSLHSDDIAALECANRELLEEFRRSLIDELDYRREAENLTTVREMLADHPRIVVPQPYPDFTTSRVLTMEFVPGRKVTDLGPLGRLELDGAPLADELFGAYIRQVLVDGVFHADPHPGNVLVTDDGRLVLLDIGMVARLAPGVTVAQASGDAPGCVALHLSGALSTDALEPLHHRGYAVGSMHPLMAVADPWFSGDRLIGAAFAMTGEPVANTAARRIVAELGGVPLTIAATQRPLYHAAAVMASNYLVALTGATQARLVSLMAVVCFAGGGV